MPEVTIKDQILKYQEICDPYHASLVAISKTKPVEMVQTAYDSGHRDFGENKVQALVEKYEALPKDIHWHMVGHLQSNKVKYLASFVHLVHSVDSWKILKEIDKQAKKNGRTIPVLMQVHIAEESTKFGFGVDELKDLLHSEDLQKLTHVEIQGVMGMATFTEDTDQIRREFTQLSETFDWMKTVNSPLIQPKHISMGMSGDYEIALECGATLIRIGTDIFGARNY